MAEALAIVSQAVAVTQLVARVFHMVQTLQPLVSRAYDIPRHGRNLLRISSLVQEWESCRQTMQALNRVWGDQKPDKTLLLFDEAIRDADAAARMLERLEKLQDLGFKLQKYVEADAHRESTWCSCMAGIRTKVAPTKSKVDIIEPVIKEFGDIVDELRSYYKASMEDRELQSCQLLSQERRSKRNVNPRSRASMVVLHQACPLMGPSIGCDAYAIDLNLINSKVELVSRLDHDRLDLVPLEATLLLRSRQCPDKFRQLRIQVIDQATPKSDIRPLFRETSIKDLGFTQWHPPSQFAKCESIESNGVDDGSLTHSMETRAALSADFYNMAKFEGVEAFASAKQNGLPSPLYFKVDQRLSPVLGDPRVSTLKDLITPRASKRSSEEYNRDDWRSPRAHLSLAKRIELAYLVAQFGYMTLGTPWASYLRSENILRVQFFDHEPPRYALDISACVQYAPVELDEAVHLRMIGRLFAEIGLEETATNVGIDIDGTWSERVRGLSKLDKEMGPEYCEATAFCLQTRQSLFFSDRPEKFDYLTNKTWTTGMSELLAEYEDRVLKRMRDLRDIALTSSRAT